jgi:uncharacterized circularly permuted ATP-grasp superfamily protein
VVNSSQGGGTKDTWILEDDASPTAAVNGTATQTQTQTQS